MRFHIGVSFRWRTIKKFLFPVLLGLLAYFGFGGIFDLFNIGILKTFALVNTNTTYTVNIPDEKTRLQNFICGNENAYDVITDFIENFDTENSYANVEIYLTLTSGGVQNANNISFYAYPKSYSMQDHYHVFGQKYGSNNSTFKIDHYYNVYNPSNTFYYVEIKGNGCSANSTNITSSSGWQSFVTFVNTGVLNSNSSTSSVSDFKKYPGGSFSPFWSDTTSLLNYLFTDNNSYTITNNWIYYSSWPVLLGWPDSCSSSTDVFCKNIIIDGVEYTYGDVMPDVHTLYNPPTPPPPEPTFIGYSTSLNTFYTSLSPSDVSNYSLTFDFNLLESVLGGNQLPEDYIANTRFDTICSGRINNLDYYSYETFNCSLTSSSTTNGAKITYRFNNLQTISNLSNYDKIYVTINTKYLDSEVNTVVYNLSYTYSLGSIINTPYKGIIYENFSNLPLDFKLYLSSNNPNVYSSVFVKKYNLLDYGIKYKGYSIATNQQNLVVGSSVLGSIGIYGNNDGFIEFSVSSSVDMGLLIYQSESAIPYPNLQLFFNDGVILSFNNSSSSTFYYIDDTGSITSNNIDINYTPSDNSYDISHYIDIVNTFINDLSNDSLTVATYTQSFYNSLPTLLQTFIFVLFILSCIYFIYISIRR